MSDQEIRVKVNELWDAQVSYYAIPLVRWAVANSYPGASEKPIGPTADEIYEGITSLPNNGYINKKDIMALAERLAATSHVKPVGPSAEEVYTTATHSGHVTFAAWYNPQIVSRESVDGPLLETIKTLTANVDSQQKRIVNGATTIAEQQKRIEELADRNQTIQAELNYYVAERAKLKAELAEATGQEKRLCELLGQVGVSAAITLCKDGSWDVTDVDGNPLVESGVDYDGANNIAGAIAALERLTAEKPTPSDEEVVIRQLGLQANPLCWKAADIIERLLKERKEGA